MRITRAILTSLAMLSVLAACKREMPASAARAPRPAATSVAIPAKKNIEALREQYYELPDLGRGVNYIDPNDQDHEVWTRYDNGLMIRDLKPTDGTIPKLGQTVSIAYVGRLYPSGKEFDRRTSSNPLTFQLGSKRLVFGFSLGISTMKTGAKRLIFIPPDLGYGAAGFPQGGIMPGQPIVFEVELLSVTGQAVSLDPDFEMPQPLGPNAPAATTSAPATR